MSMTLRSRRELYKLRELVDFLMQGPGGTPLGPTGMPLCCFCKRPMTKSSFEKHGESVGPKFVERLTIHHINHDHYDNTHSNKALCHTSCHKSYHRKKANAARALMQEVEK
jgi:hypothetical protein